jgi:CRISPR/Cas system CSM-associated protein Csm4 (group 5 of RAMP superfamily)
MDYMDEYDPDWPGDPKISTLKKMAFQAQKDISDLYNLTNAIDTNLNNAQREILNLSAAMNTMMTGILRENSISNLYFQDKISKEEAKGLWDLYKSPDEENHKVADAAIEQLTTEYQPPRKK